MSHQINWALCPEATHYLPSGFGPSLSTFWRLLNGMPVRRWNVDGLLEPSQGPKQDSLSLDGLFDRLIERPVIDFSKKPQGATHYFHGIGCVEWFQVYPKITGRIDMWGLGGWRKALDVPKMLARIPAPDVHDAPDWVKAPEGATHWVVSARERVPTGWYRADGIKMRCIALEGEYLFRLDDVQHADSGLTLIERPTSEPAPIVDWSKGPGDATHWGARTDVPGEGGYKEAFYRKVGDRFDIGVWENDWYWRPAVGLEEDRIAMLIARPAADWAEAPHDATHCWNRGPRGRWYKIDDATGKAWLLKWGEWELCYTEEGERYDISDLEPRPAAEFVPVDWSQGPEGATAFADGRWFRDNHVWDERHNYWAFQNGDTGDHAYEYPDAQYKPEPPVIWNGEGLPPVGIECERSFSYNTWKATHICGHSTDGAYAAFYDGDGLMGWDDNCKFRPLRTPEQVASDKRIEAVQVWLKGVEEQYGKEAADKCEDILMDFEKRKKAGTQS